MIVAHSRVRVVETDWLAAKLLDAHGTHLALDVHSMAGKAACLSPMYASNASLLPSRASETPIETSETHSKESRSIIVMRARIQAKMALSFQSRPKSGKPEPSQKLQEFGSKTGSCE